MAAYHHSAAETKVASARDVEHRAWHSGEAAKAAAREEEIALRVDSALADAEEEARRCAAALREATANRASVEGGRAEQVAARQAELEKQLEAELEIEMAELFGF